jgi:hypothetical protein
MIVNPNQVSECVRSGANHVGDALLAPFIAALEPLHHARRIRTNREFGFG